MKDLKNMNYSEFMQFYDENDDKFKTILDYDDFSVVKYKNRYFFYEKSENDADEFYEVSLVHELKYDINNAPNEPDIELQKQYESFCCGEYVTDDYISFMWFDKK